MRATALQPPPPTPITLIRVPVRASSSISYFKSSISISMSPSMMPMVASLLQHFADPGCTSLLHPGMFLQFRGVHGETRGGTPRGVVQFDRPILNAFGETEAGLALEDILGDVAQAGQLGAAAAQEDAADEGAFHADTGEFAAYEAEQFFGAGAQDAVDEGTLRFARLAILRGGQFHQDILVRAFGERAAEFHFDQFGVLEAEAETLGEIAREVVAGDAAGGGEVHGVAVVDHQLGGLGADIDHSDALAAVLGQDGGVAGGEPFEDRLVHREVGGVDGADEGVVLLDGGRDQVDVDFQARGKHLARVTVPGIRAARTPARTHSLPAGLRWRAWRCLPPLPSRAMVPRGVVRPGNCRADRAAGRE